MTFHVSQKQYSLLQGFYTHCYSAYHYGGELNGAFWAQQLDSHSIPWCVQNAVSSIAQERISIHLYLSTHLVSKGFCVEGIG